MERFNDLAMVIAWPEIPTRGDERWMAFLKRIGIVKNLHFKVGHAAIVLINTQRRHLHYYDFGRYVTPRGYGRARSAQSDPRLALDTRAVLDDNGQISNLQSILEEMHRKRGATHGAGIMYFSIADGISFARASAFAEELVQNGPIKYGAIAGDCNSCSRYVAQVVLAGFRPGHPLRRPLRYPESFKASPMSNVVNAATQGRVYTFDGKTCTTSRLSRMQSFGYQARLIAESLSSSKAACFPPDHIPGQTLKPERPSRLPQQVQWLGGIGEGAWYHIELVNQQELHYRMSRYEADGTPIYSAIYRADTAWAVDLPYEITYNTEYRFATIVQQGTTIRFSLIAAENTLDITHSFAI